MNSKQPAHDNEAGYQLQSINPLRLSRLEGVPKSSINQRQSGLILIEWMETTNIPDNAACKC